MIAVQAWRPTTPPTAPAAGAPVREADVEAQVRQTLEDDVAAALGENHTAEVRLVRGGKTKTLLSAAEEADLLVVDAPQQFVAGPMFAHRLVYNASCPVVVMSPQVSREPASTLSKVTEAINRGVATADGTAGRSGYRPPSATEWLAQEE